MLICSATTMKSNHDDGVLSTASVLAIDNKNEYRAVRILLDSRSQCNLITSKLCDAMKLESIPIHVNIAVISETPLAKKSKCELDILSRVSPFKIRVSWLVKPRIKSEAPKLSRSAQSIQISSHIKLDDPSFEEPGTIDIFLGDAIFWSLICVGQVKLNNEPLILKKTRLG